MTRGSWVSETERLGGGAASALDANKAMADIAIKGSDTEFMRKADRRCMLQR
jgi:hypothetical protein